MDKGVKRRRWRTLVQQILGDPQMRSILNEMQSDPKAQAARTPGISAKLRSSSRRASYKYGEREWAPSI